MEIEKSKVLIKFLLNFRQSGDVLFFLNVRRLRGYTATDTILKITGATTAPLMNFFLQQMAGFKRSLDISIVEVELD